MWEIFAKCENFNPRQCPLKWQMNMQLHALDHRLDNEFLWKTCVALAIAAAIGFSVICYIRYKLQDQAQLQPAHEEKKWEATFFFRLFSLRC